MTKIPKTISVGFPFKNGSVVNEPRLSTNRALFDFEVVVIRPYPNMASILTGVSEYNLVKAEVEGKREDLNRLLAAGGLLIVILSAVHHVVCQTGSYTMVREIRTATNYDFLQSNFYECVKNGAGTRIVHTRPDPFSKVIKGSETYWTAYIDGVMPYPYGNAAIFAANS
jgi:hypothetical protein